MTVITWAIVRKRARELLAMTFLSTMNRAWERNRRGQACCHEVLFFFAISELIYLLFPFNIMSFSIMFWNVQGAASKYFRQAFRTLVRSFNPTMNVLLEPCISGSKADAFIKFSGFERSHRVEAAGFAGGIWLLWNCPYDVHIVWNHK